ncbi:hypothetical protein APHAL10511_005901 [Amanita phalloides]|nr:hypothetical protein APHAL10511_005901 [Amanita phalloides]
MSQRKRRRLSSPVNAGLTQSSDEAEARGLPDDDENPFTSTRTLPGFASASSLHVQNGFHSCRNPPLSDHSIPAQNREACFKPASEMSFVGFQAASAADRSPGQLTATLGFSSAGTGFFSASKKSVYAPSEAALAAAQAKIEAIWNEDEENPDSPGKSTNKHSVDVFLESHKRPAFRALQNAFNSPKAPFDRSHPKTDDAPLSPLTDRLRYKGKEVENVHGESSNARGVQTHTPLSTPKPRYSKQFVSPLMTRHARPTASPRNEVNPTFSSAASQLPAHQLQLLTPRRSYATIESPIGSRPNAGPKSGTFKPPSRPFVTPFRAGARSDNIGRTPAYNSPQPNGTPFKLPRTQLQVSKSYSRFFDLTPPPNRISLKSSGLWPQKYDEESLDVTLLELTQITPTLALFYSFHTASKSNIRNSETAFEKLGSSAAFDELKRRGCSLATKSWVDNHWCLIIWKLSGMVLLDPEQEKDASKRRWCWSEAVRQLLYRYERELNQGKRPALRKITTRDAPAAFPMTLCVSDIFWSKGGRTTDGLALDPTPEIELTDGWYRLRATIDPPMARAIGRGIIRIGRKLGIAGARLCCERKEPSEVLEAYNGTKLVLSGNSSHLMPWDAKLGFHRGPCISTLHSLSPDGGCVAVVDIVVIKAFPVAYIEFFDDGEQKRREGPRNEAEEIKLHEQWKKKREQEGLKLHSEFDKRNNRYECYIDRLNRRAGAFNPEDDESPPDDIDELYESLEDPSEANATIARLRPAEAGWLVRHVRIALEKEKEAIGGQIERELQNSCPPRDVRSFRVVVAQDARTRRRPANRMAQITVWDVLGISFEEGGARGAFSVGQRYLVTNLIPTQQSAWMNCEPGSEIYLSTKRDSRWTRLG